MPRLKTCCYLKEVSYNLKTEVKLHACSGLPRTFAVLFLVAGGVLFVLELQHQNLTDIYKRTYRNIHLLT